NTPRRATNTEGNIVWAWYSDAYGVGQVADNPDGDGQSVTLNLRFPGQYYDAESGLFYNYFRDYDPSTGRYIESDPIGLNGGLNTFAYVHGNPISLVDPKGLKDVDLGQGYTGRIDSFEYKGDPSFEVHVYDKNGVEKGVHGDKGWINKHGFKGKPDDVPDEVCNRVKGVTIDELRKRNRFPPKGTVNIKGNYWKYFVRFGGAAAVVGNIQSNLSTERSCGLDPTQEWC
ncbi:RHS repeat-associated core domain-containing protein, partial [Zooshikella harenae]